MLTTATAYYALKDGFSMTKESILVTGSDGNIGSEVIGQLSSKRDGLRIVGGVHSIAKSKDRDKACSPPRTSGDRL